MSAFIVFISAVFIIYIILITIFTAGWLIKRDFRCKTSETHAYPVTVVVIFRNESANILNLLSSLLKQTYRNSELILVDDCSTDNTVNLINEFSFPNSTLVRLPEGIKGKKSALKHVLPLIKTETVVITDADCTFKENWLESMVMFSVTQKAGFVIGPVRYSQPQNYLQKFFAMDFLSLQAAGAGAAELRLPFICSAANMLITRAVLEKSVEKLNFRFSSGDDVFLLHSAINIIDSRSIRFIFSEDAVVETAQPSGIKEFVNQRIRWASKAKGYVNPMSVIVSLTVFSMSGLLIFLLTGSFFSKDLLIAFILIFILKTISDLPVIYISAQFFRLRLNIFYLPVFQFFHFLYTFIAGFLSLFITISWKNRNS